MIPEDVSRSNLVNGESPDSQVKQPDLDGFIKELIGSADMLKSSTMSMTDRKEWLKSMMVTFGIQTSEDVSGGVDSIASKTGQKPDDGNLKQPTKEDVGK